jgi:hypothetical protein
MREKEDGAREGRSLAVDQAALVLRWPNTMCLASSRDQFITSLDADLTVASKVFAISGVPSGIQQSAAEVSGHAVDVSGSFRAADVPIQLCRSFNGDTCIGRKARLG